MNLARSGFRVFPAQPRGTEPLTKNGFYNATDDEDQIHRWWTISPDANIGVATGREHGIAVIVVAGIEGEKRLARVEEKLGKLPSTLEIATETGRLLIFELPEDCGRVPSSSGDGLEIRADAGFVVAPPSVLNGKPCEWNEAEKLALAPGQFLEAARNWPSFLKALEGPTAAKGAPVGKDKGTTGEGHPETRQGRDASILAFPGVRAPTVAPGDDRATHPKTDATGAIAFLKALRPRGPWAVTAIVPDGSTITKSFETSDEAGAIRFIEEHNQAGENLYYTLNSCGMPRSKPAKADMTGAIALHVDSDPREGETIEKAKKRILVAYKAHDPPPSIIIDSGNGLQAIWLLDKEFVFPKFVNAPDSEAYKAEVQTRVAPIEDRNRALAVKVGAPAGTHNADRLLRLPGTVNWPNAKKTAEGRTACMSSIVTLTDARYPIERFYAAAKAAGQDAKKTGVASKDKTRSAKAMREGGRLKREGASYEEMRAALREHSDPGIAEWANTKGIARREYELRRVYDRTGDESPQGQAASVINPRAHYDVARLFQNGLATPLRCHRGGFYEWDGRAWPEVDEAALRARLYSFLDECQARTKTGGVCPVEAR